MQTLNQSFSDQVRITPDAAALDGLAGPVTYSHLDRRSNAIAARLMEAGVRPGTIVAVALERTVDAIASFLGVLKTGAAYCPMDLADPPARHEWMLRDIQPAALITTLGLGGRMVDDARRVYLDDVVGDAPAGWTGVLPGPNDPACVMYTSGSTGQPKGALVRHRGIVRLFSNRNPVPLGRQTRMLLHSPMHFDATTYEIWAPLLSGGTCVLFGGGAIPSLREFREHLSGYRVNTLFLGPAMFNLIVDEDVHLLDRIETLLIGGDALSPKHVRAAQAQLPRISMVNGYGPTETTTFATMYLIPRPVPDDARSIPIGQPIAGTTVHILDSQTLQPVPEGGEGELFIGSDGVALGYLNRPELTTKRFLPDPFSPEPGATMYRTGDLCKVLPDGSIDFIGRIDGQVKIRGRRVEPGEIETNLLQNAHVSQCVVAIVESGSERHIVAYYVPAEGSQITEGELRTYLEERIPAYLVPRDLIAINQIPRKPNGKIDRAELPAARRIAVTDHGRAAAGRAPESEGEKLLTDLWRDVLDEPGAGADTCFFSSGGTSLEAVRLCCLIERQTGKFIAVSTLLENSTPNKLAGKLFDSKHSAPDSGLLALNGQPAPINLFCLSGQVLSPLSLQPIAQRLGSVVKAWGVPFLDRNVNVEAFPDTEETARECLKMIRSQQPVGPYHFLGYSYGGVVAFEMAQQLRAAGQSVATLVMLDTDIPTRLLRFIYYANRMLLGAGRLPMIDEPDKVYRFDRRPDSSSASAWQVITRVNRLLRRVNTKYRPSTYGGDLLFIRSSQVRNFVQRLLHPPAGGWVPFVAGQLTSHQVTGDHYTMLEEPHAAAVAEIVRNYLADRTNRRKARELAGNDKVSPAAARLSALHSSSPHSLERHAEPT